MLGAGFGGLELATVLSAELGADAGVTLIDASDSFVFGYSKLDVMFGRVSLDEVRLSYSDIVKPGVRFLRETITAIDPEARRVTTDVGVHEADVLVVALGADYSVSETPGIVLGQNEFYSVAGAETLRDVLPSFMGGHAVVGICDAPFKCPPAPSEAALLLHDHLVRRSVRDECEISLVLPFSTPVPPSPDTSAALLEAFAERGIAFVRAAGGSARRRTQHRRARRRVGASVRPLPRSSEAPSAGRRPRESYGRGRLRPGGPAHARHALPRRLRDRRRRDGRSFQSRVFSEGAARVVAASIVARRRGSAAPDGYDGRGSCYVEFGADRVGRVDVDFLSGPKPTGTFREPTLDLVAEKKHFGASRRARWFGR